MNNNYKYGHLTEELLSLLPQKAPRFSELLDSKLPVVKRFNQMQRAYGDLAVDALAEASFLKYPATP